MQILELKNIERKDVPLYYRRFYSGTIVMDIMNSAVERFIDFSVEMMPTGKKEIKITFDKPVDYPTIPLMNELKKFLNEFDSTGGLPV